MFSMATCSLTHPDTSQPDHRLFGLLPGEGWKLRGLSMSQSLQAQALLCFACFRLKAQSQKDFPEHLLLREVHIASYCKVLHVFKQVNAEGFQQ